MNQLPSLFAKDHNLFLKQPADALNAIGSGVSGCIFTEEDIADDFFDLKNGLAGEVFQKFVNYNFLAAFIVPETHNYGERVTELIRDHKRHSVVRFFTHSDEAVKWLQLTKD